jgi:hypothetical protein
MKSLPPGTDAVTATKNPAMHKALSAARSQLGAAARSVGRRAPPRCAPAVGPPAAEG